MNPPFLIYKKRINRKNKAEYMKIVLSFWLLGGDFSMIFEVDFEYYALAVFLTDEIL